MSTYPCGKCGHPVQDVPNAGPGCPRCDRVRAGFQALSRLMLWAWMESVAQGWHQYPFGQYPSLDEARELVLMNRICRGYLHLNYPGATQ